MEVSTLFNRILTDVNLADVVGGWSQFLSVLVTIGAIVIARQQLIATREQIKQSELAMLEQMKQAEEQQKLTQQQLEQIQRAEMPEALVFLDWITSDLNSYHIDLFNVKRAPIYVRGFHVEGQTYGKSYYIGSSYSRFESSHPLDGRAIILNQGDSFRITITEPALFFDVLLGPEEERRTGSINAVFRFDTPFVWKQPFLEFKIDIEKRENEIIYKYSYSTDGDVYTTMFHVIDDGTDHEFSEIRF